MKYKRLYEAVKILMAELENLDQKDFESLLAFDGAINEIAVLIKSSLGHLVVNNPAMFLQMFGNGKNSNICEFLDVLKTQIEILSFYEAKIIDIHNNPGEVLN
jgi:hypothetical protein